MGDVGNMISDLHDEVERLSTENDKLKKELGAYTKRRQRLPPGECKTCDEWRDEKFHPAHDASPRCQSGKHAHCTCDTCF
jgi:hypothetical protein